MARRLMQTAVVLVVIIALAQLTRPQRANPRVPRLSLERDRVAVVCANRAPVLGGGCWCGGWAKGVLAKWGGYSPERQRKLLAAACRDVSTGKMPGSLWTRLHPEARLSSKDIEALCASAQQNRRGGRMSWR